jgi:hypothetical protein
MNVRKSFLVVFLFSHLLASFTNAQTKAVGTGGAPSPASASPAAGSSHFGSRKCSPAQAESGGQRTPSGMRSGDHPENSRAVSRNRSSAGRRCLTA